MASIGFIGLGHMGLPMAINLVKAGHHVKGYDLDEDKITLFTKAGGMAAQKLHEIGNDHEIIISMLPTGQHVHDIYLGDQGLLSQLTASKLIIDCSSIDVPTSQELARQASLKQHIIVDAPVSGGVAGAQAATLTFMVGGQERAFQEARPLLEKMGKTIIHTGPAGSGQAAKICNNMILGISMIAVSEAFVLAQHLGLSPQKLFEVVNNASGQCWVMSKYTPVPGLLENAPANNHYQPGFTAAMMLKDLNLSQNSATTVGVETPMGACATALYQQFNEAGLGQLDFSAIIKIIAKEQQPYE